ncbi:MAG: acetyl-CoA carboxylase biotin carboxyl carrier protein [Bacteroidota bacterium]|nr:acetyl-CoA carboxylase biotin carboxyl carrier protein [Bacteroidota bacterium]
MDLKYVKQLLELVEKSTVNEIEVEEKGHKIRITKAAAGSASAPMLHAMMPSFPHQVMMPAAPALPAEVSSASEAKPAAPIAETKKYHEIKSPIVGTFYRSPSPEAGPYVDVGTKVKQGTVLCIVEAMKLMNEIESDTAGTIVKVCVDNTKPVEYGQVLFLVEP